MYYRLFVGKDKMFCVQHSYEGDCHGGVPVVDAWVSLKRVTLIFADKTKEQYPADMIDAIEYDNRFPQGKLKLIMASRERRWYAVTNRKTGKLIEKIYKIYS